MSGVSSVRWVAIAMTCAISAAVPSTTGFAAETSRAATIPATIAPVSVEEARANLITETPGDAVEAPALALDTPDQNDFADASRSDAELDCMAKVVHHEAANQSRQGQLAVAQLIMNRLESGRFADSICGVVNQRGQFFNTHAYNPRRDTATWAMAMSVSREARDGVTADVVPGAMFYHASYQPAPRFFRSRPRAGTLGDHIFYR